MQILIFYIPKDSGISHIFIDSFLKYIFAKMTPAHRFENLDIDIDNLLRKNI